MNNEQPTVARLVTTTWGWSLVVLFLCLTLAMGVYWNHPVYESGNKDMSRFQEFVPLIMAGAVWSIAVVFMIISAVVYGPRHSFSSGDFRHVKVAEWFFFVVSGIFALILPGTVGAIIATFINSCLLIMCLIYIGITKGITGRFERDALLCACLVVLSIAACWI